MGTLPRWVTTPDAVKQGHHKPPWPLADSAFSRTDEGVCSAAPPAEGQNRCGNVRAGGHRRGVHRLASVLLHDIDVMSIATLRPVSAGARLLADVSDPSRSRVVSASRPLAHQRISMRRNSPRRFL